MKVDKWREGYFGKFEGAPRRGNGLANCVVRDGKVVFIERKRWIELEIWEFIEGILGIWRWTKKDVISCDKGRV